MQITKAAELKQNNVSQAFNDLLQEEDMLRIITKDGNFSLINRNLIRFTSPLVNSILSDVPCCNKSMVFIPEVSKVAVDHVLGIIKSGFSDFNSVSIKQIQEVQDAAKMLQIDLTDLDYVKKCLVVEHLHDTSFRNKTCDTVDEIALNISIKTEEPEENNTTNDSTQEESEENIADIFIKAEYSETLHGSGSVDENINTNVDVKEENEQNIHKENELRNNGDISKNTIVVDIQEENEQNMHKEIDLRINCDISEKTTELVEDEPSTVENTGTIPEVNGYPGLVLTPPPEQSMYSPFKMPLKKRKYSEEIVNATDEPVFAPTPPPPENQNHEILMSEFPFYSSEVPTPQKERSQEKERIQEREMIQEKETIQENLNADQESGIDIVPFLHRAPKSKSKSVYQESHSTLTECKPIETPRSSKKSEKHSPIDALAHHALVHLTGSGPPRSTKPELQYLYRPFYHDKCGERHSRVDDCRASVPHRVCGKQHSYFKRCDGSWMRLQKLEEVAGRWKDRRRIQEDDTLDNNDEDMTAVGVFVQPEHELYHGPPISKRPELQYVYESFLHPKCGKTHRRVDLCEASPPHNICGRKHSYAMECGGSWMNVEKFEMLAMKWPTTRMRKKKADDHDGLKRKRIRYDSHNSNMQKPYKEMSEDEKRLNTCMDWNFGQCVDCKFGNRKRHRCSRMVTDPEVGERICWGDHREVEHGVKDGRWKKESSSPDWDLRKVIVKSKLF